MGGEREPSASQFLTKILEVSGIFKILHVLDWLLIFVLTYRFDIVYQRCFPGRVDIAGVPSLASKYRQMVRPSGPSSVEAQYPRRKAYYSCHQTKSSG